MVRLYAIVMLSTMLLNWFSIPIVSHVMQAREDKVFAQTLSNGHYDPAQLIELEAPLDLPYSTDWISFERADGEVTLNGMVYTFVERKYTNGVMIYKCLPNPRKAELLQQEHSQLKKQAEQQQGNSGDDATHNFLGKKTVSDVFFASFQPLHIPEAEDDILLPLERTASTLCGHERASIQPPDARC